MDGKFTLQMNGMGCLHVWEGHGVPVRLDKYLWEMDGRQADVYMQVDYVINDFLGDFDREVEQSIREGWAEHATVGDDMQDYLQNLMM